ncbi:UNVERIFIED_CONTAM: hypothetical protein GTU68_066593 [Idotea baltica]|nr:hypothetical protein [Idotea baltica]
MNLLSGILGQFIQAGVLALLIVFQPEVRRFLLYIGRGSRIGKTGFWKSFFIDSTENKPIYEGLEDQISKAINNLATTKTGALIVFTPSEEKQYFASTGTLLNADISSKLLESIFNKKSPLHDGAIVITDQKIVAGGCVLPVSENPDLPQNIGMRHRAAVGITEHIDAGVIIVSEETGKISIASKGKIRMNASQKGLSDFISDALEGKV